MRARSLALALLVGLASSLPVAGQDSSVMDRRAEMLVLREASQLEAQGRLAEAVSTLEGLLDRKPTSAAGLLALERVLRAAGGIETLLPRIDTFIEGDPKAAGPRTMKLRVLMEVDSIEALPAAAEAWLRVDPGSPDPYREVARVYETAFGADEGLEVLLRGRDAVPDHAPLALETGDALVALGRTDEGVEAWAGALADPAADVEGVLRRFDRLSGSRSEAAESVIEALLAEPVRPDRRLAAVRVSLRELDAERSRVVAEAATEGLGPGAERRLLDRLADAARDAGVPTVSLWALQRMRSRSPGQVQPAAMEARLAEAALAAGDTATALAAQGRFAGAFPPGSPERRLAMADLIRIEAHRADAVALEARLEGFRREFPDAPEADELAATAAAGLAARGLAGAALDVTDQASGPRSLLERAWLLFGEGDFEAGRGALEAALPSVAPTRATEIVQLLARLDRVGPAAGRALAAAASLAHQGRPDEALARLETALDSVRVSDRAPLRHRAAELALAGGDEERGRGHLRALLEESPGSPEVPEAMFGLARSLAVAGEVGEARTLLETLILERPQAAVVPAARRELQRIGRGG